MQGEKQVKLKSLMDLFVNQLRDVYNAELQQIKAFPKMAKKASSPHLIETFHSHLEQTENHVYRLDSIGMILKVKLAGKKSAIMRGLIEDGSDASKTDGDAVLVDLEIIYSAQLIEHYEIFAYGTILTLAEQLGESKITVKLQDTFDEEVEANRQLRDITKNILLPQIQKSRSTEKTATHLS